MKSPNRFSFDYSVLEKFDIDQTRLPPNSLIINRPVSWYEVNKLFVLTGIATTFLLFLLVVFLLGNIAKRRKIEKHLQQSEQRLAQIIDFLPDPTFVIDQQSRIIAWNRTMEETTGVRAENVLGKGDWEYALPFYGKRRPVVIDLVNQWDDEVAKRYRNVKKEGDRILVETQRPIRLLNGRHFKITAGPLYDQKELTGKTCHSVLCPAETGNCPIKSLEKIDPSERTLLTVDGKKVPVLKTAIKAQLQGRDCFIESFIDLSKQRRAEENQKRLKDQLRRAQKMEALGTLAGGIAHDFNNILSAVLGYSELGMQDLNDTHHPLFSKLQAINNAGHRAKKLVEQILAFGRMQEQLKAPVLIAPIIKEGLKLLRSSLPATIRIQSNILSEKPVMGDPTQFHQVIMNLCTNAYHAMQYSGGILDVRLEDVLLASDDIDTPEQQRGLSLSPGQYLKLVISDTGSGINPAILNRIFDPYFTTKEKGKGTGLGLAVVHGIVTQCGGEITVSSQLGKGTTFTVFLPASERSSIEDAMHSVSFPRGKEHVLLVDDEVDLVEIGKTMLHRLGYRVTAVTGSLEALEIFKRNPSEFDILLTDYNMPDLTGDQLAMHILSICQGIPVLIYSGFTNTLEKERADTIGIRKMLMKPLTMEALAYGLREALDS